MRADDFSLASGLALDHGIRGLSRTRGDAAERLPTALDSPWLAPPEAGAVSHLDALFASPGLDSALAATLRPAVHQLGLLHPSLFRATLAGAQDGLETLAGQTTDPAQARTLRAALRELGEARKLLEYHHERLLDLVLG